MYLRWVRWVREVRMKHNKILVVNMDETSLSRIKSCKHGVHFQTKSAAMKGMSGVVQKRRGMTCSLLGLICGNDAIQKDLPQVILPKHRNQETPPMKLKQMWSDTGSPLEAWHRTSGWNSSLCMRQWVRRMHSQVKKVDPDSHVMLVMDCAGVHTCTKVLKLCRSLKISPVFIPGRCTWFLQPLDTHVFGKLKKTLRMEITKAMMTQKQGQVPDALNVKTMGFAIQDTLVKRTWSSAMDKVGLGQTWANMRLSLQEYIKGEDMSPKHPGDDELMFMMGRLGKSRIDWQQLLFKPFEPGSPEAVPTSSDVVLTSAITLVPAGTMPAPVKTPSVGSQHAWHERAFLPLSSGGHPLILKRLPPARNVDVEPESLIRIGPSAGTRTQTKQRDAKSVMTSEAASSGLQR